MKIISILGFIILLLLGSFQSFGQVVVESNTQSDVVLTHAELQNMLETIIKARRARMMRARYYQQQRQYAYQQQPPQQQDNSKELAEMQALLKELDTKMQSTNSSVERQELEDMRASILRDISATQSQPNVVIHNNIRTDSNRIAYQPTPNPPQTRDNRDLEAELERIRKELAKDRKPRRSKTINKDYTYTDDNDEYDALVKRIRELEKERKTVVQAPQAPPAPQVIIKEVPREVKTQDDTQFNELLAKYQELANQMNNRPVPDNSLSEQRYNDLLGRYEALLQQVNNRPVPETKIIYKETTPRLEEKEWFNNRRVIYFDNASHSLRTESNALLDEIAGLLSRHSSLKVVIKGFASRKGTPEYNLLLSERRASSIKSGLMRRGIDPTRITSDFHGIDYRPANEQEARRAEIIFLAN